MLVERRTRDRKVASSSPGRSGGRFFFFRVIFYADSYSVSVPPRVTAVARKRPWSFCQKCWWKVTPKRAYVLDPMKSEWTDYAVQAQRGNLLWKQAHMQLVRVHTATVWTDPGVKSGFCMCKLISTVKRKKKRAGGE